MEYLNTDYKKHQLILDGYITSLQDLDRMILATTDKRRVEILIELRDFLTEWFSDSKLITLHTSGSTGTPKTINVAKSDMIASAVMTCKRLDITPGMTALLCMPVRYIAGRMMVVRAMVCSLNLLLSPPSSHPMRSIGVDVDFAAMVPMQVHGSLTNPVESLRMCKIGRLLIGGGPVDDTILHAFRVVCGEVYSTYGMTETVSHVALRRISGRQASEWYYPLDGVTLSHGHNKVLVIKAPHLCRGTQRTNDVVEFNNDGGFKILGRIDNVINSGGVKIQAEEVESQLSSIINVPFVITSVPDDVLGNAVTLLLQSDAPLQLDFHHLPRYWSPRHILYTSEIPLTPTGKPNRPAIRDLASKLLSETIVGYNKKE